MRPLAIAYGNSRQAKTWVNKTLSWDELTQRLSQTIRTTESAEEYAKMSKSQRDALKDHGGFVGGVLKGGRRKIDTVEFRSMITLDGDRIDPEFLTRYETAVPYASAMYTTHSHTPENPRVRLVFPTSRNMSPDEFVAVARYLAQSLGIDYFDECSYRPNQLMYWPSTPANGEFIFRETHGDWLNPDVILNAHPEWKDPTQLPTSSRESRANTLGNDRVQDPLTKEGIVGVFNRVFYPITRAIEKFLPEIYEPTDNENRWRYTQSSSMPGVEILESGRFAYSHHAKDPAYLHLCNAFDLVRTHLFPNDDEKRSYRDMCSFAVGIDEVNRALLAEKQEEAERDFDDWTKELQCSRNGELINSLHNLTLILEHDPYLKNIVFNELADSMEAAGDLPWKHRVRFWRDADDAQLVCYVDSHYGTFSARNYDMAVQKVADDRSYHPILNFLDSLPEWDGVERVDTLLIDYLGADDNAYVRAVSRKALCAAIMRVKVPGIKFDYITVLNGPQGIGKSTFISKLGGEWYSDSLNLSDMNDKTAAEKLQGYWIMEIGELAGMKKADLDKVKAFISRQDDKYRASFGRRVTPHPRQCVFFGTTNSENGYLRDITGNRRYWTVKTPGTGKKKPWDITPDEIRQIWAEALQYAEEGEPLYLSPELDRYASREQSAAMEQDDREGLVSAYLEMLLPETWDSMDVYARREYVNDPNGPLNVKGTIRRQTVSNIEIWCECFGKSKEEIKPADSYAINAIMMRIGGWVKKGSLSRLAIYGMQRVYQRK